MSWWWFGRRSEVVVGAVGFQDRLAGFACHCRGLLPLACRRACAGNLEPYSLESDCDYDLGR
jgi:hypothetical protein